jgi:hypothetical protein
MIFQKKKEVHMFLVQREYNLAEENVFLGQKSSNNESCGQALANERGHVTAHSRPSDRTRVGMRTIRND